MENASKALIIAGAILLSILIISLGIMIFGQASGVVNNNAMNEVEISSFNQKFLQFEGTNVKGAQVNSLLNIVIQNNVTNQDDTSKQVEIKAGAAMTVGTNWQTTALPTSETVHTSTSTTGKAMTGKTYEIVCTPNTNSGLIELITITAK